MSMGSLSPETAEAPAAYCTAIPLNGWRCLLMMESEISIWILVALRENWWEWVRNLEHGDRGVSALASPWAQWQGCVCTSILSLMWLLLFLLAYIPSLCWVNELKASACWASALPLSYIHPRPFTAFYLLCRKLWPNIWYSVSFEVLSENWQVVKCLLYMYENLSSLLVPQKNRH